MVLSEREATLRRLLVGVEAACSGFVCAIDRRSIRGHEFSEEACWEDLEVVFIALLEAAPEGFGGLLRVWASESDAEGKVT